MRMTKGIALVCTLILAVFLLGGCKGNSDTKKESSTKIVKVTSVNNKTIKGVVGELEESSNKGASGSNQNETPPAKPDGDSSQNGNPPAMPDKKSSGSDNQNEKQSGNAGNGKPEGMPGGSNFKESSENITFKVTDSTTIKVENPQGTEDGEVKDISKDSILEVVLDKNNNATKITIKNQGPGAGGGAPEGTSGNSDSSASKNGVATLTVSQLGTYTATGGSESAPLKGVNIEVLQ